MCHEWMLDGEFLMHLVDIDEEIARKVQAQGCDCGGRLDRADYPRKVRGLPAEVDEAYSRRNSFCCCREGCRKRTTPPSVRFLGRRVYAGAVVVLGSVFGEPSGGTYGGLGSRTVRRWLIYFRTKFLDTALWRTRRSHLRGEVDESRLPLSLWERFSGSVSERLLAFLQFVSPMTTTLSAPRFLRLLC